MFVSQNTLSAIKEYFFKALNEVYPTQEIQSFFYILAEHYLGFTKTDVLLGINKNLSESELLKFHYAIKELTKNKPIQYITGEQYFYEYLFKVNEHTLIPRPETEELVALIIKENTNSSPQILDIGTGSGAIAISLDLQLRNSSVTAFDVSEEAINVSTFNSNKLGAEVNFILQNILAPDYQGTSFDVIVSNPPYVLKKEMREMQANVLDYEPHLALFVEDDDPLIFYKSIVEFSQIHLKSGGKLYVEINEKYGNQTVQLLQENKFILVELIQDLNGKDRIIKGIKV